MNIRNDDVLIYKGITPSMKLLTRKKGFFEYFVEADKWFEERKIPMALAVLADGIDIHKEWVQYIKERLHRYSIQFHGHTHINYRNRKKEDMKPFIKEGIQKVEDTFHVKVERFYFPFSRRGFPSWGIELCDELGIEFHNRNLFDHRYFHYWNPRSVNNIKKLYE